MNCLYITLFFNTVAGIFQTFLSFGTSFRIPESQKSPASPLNHVMTSSCTSSSSSNFQQCSERPMFHLQSQWSPETISFLCVAREKLQRGTHPFRSYDGTHFAFGGTLDRRYHFKQVSLKQSRFYHCQRSTAHR